MNSARRRIAIATGGTAGHIYPAFAISDAYQALGNVDVLFVGAANGSEARLARSRGYEFQPIPASPFVGEDVWRKAQAVRDLSKAIMRGRCILKSASPRLVLGFGGFASAGTLLAACSLRIPTAIHESNSVAGFTNQLLGRLVDRVYLGFESAKGQFPAKRILVTGNPVRSDVAALSLEPRLPPAEERRARILVTGGSQGSPFLNAYAPAMLSLLAMEGWTVDIIHQTGLDDPGIVQAAYARLGLSVRSISYIDDMVGAYRWANFVIACAGAATMAELANLGLPALLVPLSRAARNHQIANAIAFARVTGGWWVGEDKWQPEQLAHKIAALLHCCDAWKEASSRIRQLAAPQAASVLIEDCEALIAR